MLTEIFQALNNWFVRDVVQGDFTISNGSIALPFLLPGQVFRIVGSALNDGVYRYPASELQDETFSGEIWAMAVPPAVLKLAADIEEWVTKNAAALDSPYTSESFGGYSYSKGASGSNGGAFGWRDQFAGRLAMWRKLR